MSYLDCGDYVVFAGNSSKDVVFVGIITLPETITTLKTRNCLGNPGFEDYSP